MQDIFFWSSISWLVWLESFCTIRRFEKKNDLLFIAELRGCYFFFLVLLGGIMMSILK